LYNYKNFNFNFIIIIIIIIIIISVREKITMTGYENPNSCAIGHQYKQAIVAQVISWRPLMTEVRVSARVCPCGICGGQIGTGRGLSASSSAFPGQYYSNVLSILTYLLGMNNRPVSGRSSETWSHPIDMIKNKRR
jgi:hypothetical protein